MGFFGDAVNRIRAWAQRDKEQTALQFAKGSTTSGYPTTGYDLLQAYGYDLISDYLKLEQDLMSRYVDYEEMSESALVATALEIYADDATQLDGMQNRTFWLSSQDKTIQEMGDDLFDRTLRMSEDIWSIAHNTCLYGSDFEEILVNDQGVRGLNFLPTPTMRRIEGPRGELFGFVQDFKMRFGMGPAEFQQILAARNAMRLGGPNQGTIAGMERVTALEDWEVVHFRLQGRKRRSIYGASALDPARFIWKRMMLLEDSALIYRLTRSAERFAFYVDTGDLPPQEALAHLNRVRQQNKKKAFLNPATGKLDYKAKIMNQQDDFYVPVRNGAQGTRIEVLGAPAWQATEDLEFFLRQLHAALKVPKAYMAQDDGGSNRGTLSSMDVRFARTILRIQRELKNGGAKIFRTHLAALNIDPQQVDYTLHMTTPSAIFELAHLEVQNARADLAARMDPFVDKYFLLSHVFKLSDEEIQLVMQRRESDADREANIQASSQSIIQRALTVAGMQGQAQGQVDTAQIMNTAGMPTPDQHAQQMQQQQMQAQQQQAQAQKTKKESVIGGPLIKIRDGVRPREYYGLERTLFEHRKPGNEKKLEEKMDKLLRSDRITYERLNQVAGLLQEVVQATRGVGRGDIY